MCWYVSRDLKSQKSRLARNLAKTGRGSLGEICISTRYVQHKCVQVQYIRVSSSHWWLHCMFSPFQSEVFLKKLWLSCISDEWLFQKNCELGREFLAFGEYMGRWSRRMSSSKAFIRSLFDCPVGVDFFCCCFFVNLVASYLLSFNVCLPEMIKVHRQLGATYQINIYQFNISL